ncbi:MAG: hypothetical protein AAF525_23190, partial [Pseudomonadota bacterium]
VPDESAIFSIALNTQDLRSIPVSGNPSGIALSDDGNALFVALSEQGSVSILNLDSEIENVIDVATELGTDAAWDVLPMDDRFYTVGNPGVGDAFVTSTNVNDGISTRIADQLIVRDDPSLSKAVDDHIFVRSGLAEDRIDKIDSTTDELILQRTGLNTLTRSGLAVVQDGSALALTQSNGLGLLVDADDLLPMSGDIGILNSTIENDPRLFTAWFPIFGGTAQLLTAIAHPGGDVTSDAAVIQCDGFFMQNVDHLQAIAGGTGFLVLQGDEICIYYPFE